MQVHLMSFYHVAQVTELMYAHREEIDNDDGLVYNEQECIEGLCLAIDSEHDLIFVACDGAKVIGYMWLTIVKPHFCVEHFMSEQYLYITPSRRRSRAMLMLIRQAKETAFECGCEYLQLAVTSEKEKVEEAYTKRYKRVGSVYRISLGELENGDCSRSNRSSKT